MSDTDTLRRGSSLEANPFAVLGASPRDGRQALIDRVEDAALHGDEPRLRQAGAELLHPRQRLAAEMRWLPGVSPAEAARLLRLLRQTPDLAFTDRQGSALVRANLMASALEVMPEPGSPPEVLERIQTLAASCAGIEAAEALRDINEDRLVSGFPELRDISAVEEELRGLRRHWRDCVRNALDRLSSAALLEVVTGVARYAATEGAGQTQALMDDVIDAYELEARAAIDAGAEAVPRAIDAVQAAIPGGEAAVFEAMRPMEQAIAGWHRLANPILLSARARGLHNQDGTDLGWKLRELGILLFNAHGMLRAAERVTGLLRQYFAEIPGLSDKAAEDAGALDEIARSRQQAAAEQAEWLNANAYRVTLGLMFKEVLAISAAGIEIKGRTIPLEAVTRVRWGSVSHSVNGIPTGTKHTIAVGDATQELSTTFGKQEVFDAFLHRLWRAVCVRLIVDMARQLEAGQAFRFGDAVILDQSAELTRRRLFAADERRTLPWSDTEIWSVNGSFIIGQKDDKKTRVALPYLDVANVHLLEHIIRASFRKGGRRLSDALR